MRYQQSMRKRALLDGLPAYYIGQHHKKCSVPCQRESLYLRLEISTVKFIWSTLFNKFFSEKEVFKIMGLDRLRREGSQIEVQDLEKNRMLDIGKCHGACRHIQNVSDFKDCSESEHPTKTIYFRIQCRKGSDSTCNDSEIK